MEKRFTDQDWVEFKRLYLDDLYLFAIKGKVQPDKGDNPGEYHTIYDVANFEQDVASGENAKVENEPVSLRLNLNTKDGGLKNITKSDIDNAIDAFKHFIRYAATYAVKKSLLDYIKILNSTEVIGTFMVDAAVRQAENVTKNIIEKYFGLNPEKLLEEKKEKERFNQLEYLFREILRIYYPQYSPLYVLRIFRNKMTHIDGIEINEGEESREVIKFFIFTYIWVIAICRKILISLLSSDCELYRPMKSKYELKQKLLDNLDKIQGYRYNEFSPGMDMQIKVLKAEPKSIFWKLRKKDEYRQIQGPDVECGKYVIPGVFRYENIIIKVETTNGDSKEFECTISKKYTVAKEGSITLDFEYGTYNIDLCATEECHITEEETAKLPVPDDTVTLDITSDLECSMTIPGVVQDYPIACNENVKFKIPKGRHEITLTSKANPSYTMTCEVEVTGDTVIKDMLFAEEVKNHREWWDEKDIVVLKETGSRELYKYVLWDKSVNLPVYNALCYRDDDFFASASLSLLGNFFYVRKGEINLLYSIRSSEDPLHYKLEKAFAIKDKWYALVTRYSAVVDGWNLYEGFIIDKTGTEVFKLPEFCAMTYTIFAQHFKFSEGYAAMLGPDGETISFISEKWKRRSNVYCWESDNYPVFRDGFCAVRKADEGCLFLEIKDGEICERSERYDRLVPKQGDGKWAYEAEKDGRRSLIVPEKDGGLKEILSYDSMKNLSNGFRVITLTTDDGVLKRKVILNAIGKVIATDFVDYELIDPCGVIVTYADKTTCVYDAGGNCYIRGLWESYTTYPSFGLLRGWMNGRCEVWRCKDCSWSKIADFKGWIKIIDGILSFRDPERGLVSVMNKDGDKLIKYAGNWVWEKDEGKIAPEHPITYLFKCVHTLVTFANIVCPERIGLMRRDTLEEVVTPGYEKIERVGNLWVAYNAQGKTLFSDLGEQLLAALEIDSVQEFTSDLYIVGTEGGYCLVDAYGNMKTKCYSEIRKAVNGYAAFKEYDDWGFLRISGDNVEVACSTAYYQVKDFTPEGYAMVQQNQDGDWGLIDSEGNLVVDCCYDHIDPFKCDYTSARKRVNWTIVKKKGC